MKILFITGIYPPVMGGASTYFSGLLPELERFTEVDSLLLLTEHGSGFPSTEHLTQKISIFRWMFPRFNLRLYQNPKWRMSLGILTYLWLPCVTLLIRVLWKPTVIHIHCTYAKTAYLRFCRFIGFYIIVDQKDFFVQSDYSQAHRVISSTLAIKNTLIGFGVNPLIIEDIAIPQPPMPPVNNEEAVRLLIKHHIKSPFLLYVGTIHERKGILELLEAYRQWTDRNEYRLVLVGRNIMGPQFIDLIHDDSSILYVGELPHQEVLLLMSKMQLFILPSKSEALGHTCLESMRLTKKALLPPSVLEFQEYCPRFVIPEITPKAIIQKMDEILSSPDIPVYPLENHDPTRVAQATLNLYKSLLVQKCHTCS